MKKKIKNLLERLHTAVRHNPVEVALAALFCCLGFVLFETDDVGVKVVISYFPVCFLVTYSLNMLSEGTRWRFAYYLSGLFFLLFFCREEESWSAFYGVSLVVAQLFYLVCGWKRDNEVFVWRALGYLKAMFSAGVLAGIAWLLSCSIYFSIRYIFEIWEEGYERFMGYSVSIAFLGILPLLFLMFNHVKAEVGSNKLFDTLLNYVLTPALLVYAAILYLYFVKIAVLWSLPKGAVAYIVISFVAAIFVLKGCQAFLGRRCYDWFFRYSSWWALPTLVMYWVGTFYRIHEYGYTEARVYLVAVGAILTGLVLLFFFKQTGRYLYVAVWMIFCLSAVTYIPGITAKDIERISQEKRDNYPMKEGLSRHLEYITISDYSPLDLTGFATLQKVGLGDEGEVNSVMRQDTFYLFDREKQVLFRERADVLFTRQLKEAGLSPSDSIPESAYPEILRLDLDSALYVFGEISVTRRSPDSAYSVSYMGAGYYLKKITFADA